MQRLGWQVSGCFYLLLKLEPLGQPTLSLAPLEFLDRLAALVSSPAALAIGITACSPLTPSSRL